MDGYREISTELPAGLQVLRESVRRRVLKSGTEGDPDEKTNHQYDENRGTASPMAAQEPLPIAWH
jgi:hypothetical protein